MFAYKRLAQGLNSCLPAFTSFVREYLDPNVKTDRCAQFVNEIGVAAHTLRELVQNIELVF